MQRRPIKDIKQDRDAYLEWAVLLRDMGDFKGYLKYVAEVKAMGRELMFQRYGCTNVI